MNREEITRRKTERKERRRNKRNALIARKVNKMAGTIVRDNIIMSGILEDIRKQIKEKQDGQADTGQSGGDSGSAELRSGGSDMPASVSNAD